MAWRGREGWPNFVFSSDSRVVDEEENDEGWRWGRYGRIRRIWGISSTTCPIGFRILRISLHTCRIGDCTYCIGYGISTVSLEIPKSQFLMMISPISSHLHLSSLSFSSTTLPSAENTKLTRSSLPLHPRKIYCLPFPSQFLISHLLSLGTPYYSLLAAFPWLQVNLWIESQQLSHFAPKCLSPDEPPPARLYGTIIFCCCCKQ
jgi:hypothetical protein